MKNNPTKEATGFWFILGLVLVSRLPFLMPGFGSEEDAWGLFYIARKVATTGLYEVSRLPGHPLQEFVYIALWRQGAWAFNTLTALFSVAATGFFMAALKKLQVRHYLVAGVVFAFIPVVYLNSCNAMDYLWAMAFLMAAFYAVAARRFVAAGILVGLATGCRITSMLMIVPFAVLAFEKGNRDGFFRRMFMMTSAALVTTLLAFAPVIAVYGASFFGVTAQIPVSLPKAVFNATIGLWGVIGFTDLCFALLLLLRNRKKNESAPAVPGRRLAQACLAAIVVYGIAYIPLPQKAAFFIPALPFVITWMALYMNKTYLTAFSFSMIFSSFFIGLNLNDPARGATSSRWSIGFKIGGKPIALDFLRGPMMAEKIKRQNKIAYSDRVAEAINRLSQKSVVIAGFWSSNVLAKAYPLPAHVRVIYFEPEDSLIHYARTGSVVYYIPGQDEYNDRAFRNTHTADHAKALPMEE